MFKGQKKTFKYTQINLGNIKDVFPLLCPVRESEWLDGWTYKMIYSKSGLIEKDCVFTTSQHGKFETVWQVTNYDRDNHMIEFIRLTPEEEIVKINIQLNELDNKTTQTDIVYRYTSLNESKNKFYENGLENEFKEMMQWWEKAINYFLKYGKILKI